MVEHAHCGFDVRYIYCESQWIALVWAAALANSINFSNAVESYKIHNQLMQHLYQLKRLNQIAA